MAAKGPSANRSGLNIKGKKQKSEIDVDALLAQINGDDEEYFSSNEDVQNRQEEIKNQPLENDEATKEAEALAEFLNKKNQQQVVQVETEQTPVLVQTKEEPKEKNLLTIKVEKIDPSKPFNQQQPRRQTNVVKIEKEFEENTSFMKKPEETEERSLEEKVQEPNSPKIEEQQFPQEEIVDSRAQRFNNLRQSTEPQNYEENDELDEENDSEPQNKKKKKAKKNNKTNNKSSKKQPKEQNQKGLTPEKLRSKGYPKKYYDPTDEEIDQDTGEADYFFNIEKTLRKNNMMWITKIIPLATLDRLTYDKKPLDSYAKRQHETATKLNASTPQEQYSYDSRNRTVKFLAGGVAVLLCVLFVVFHVIPNNNYNKGITYFQKEDWSNSYLILSEVGDYKDAKYYCKYAEAMQELNDKEYEEAKADFELLLPYLNIIPDAQSKIYECDYRKAKAMYSSGQYEEAAQIFSALATLNEEPYEYEDSKTYYYKCGYEIADGYYETGELNNALDAFFKVKSYDDANDRVIEIASQIYNDAKNYYNLEDYNTAKQLFTYLSKYSYKDTKSMIQQCTYREALNLYNDGEYEEARKNFAEVISYKDSNAMYKECGYRIAKLKYAESIEDSLLEYSNISSFRDVETILKQPVFEIFGEWKIIEMNGAKTTEISFKFNTGGYFQTNKQVLYTAISTDANKIPYKWNGSCYSTEDGTYTLSAKYIDEDTMDLTCTEPDKTVTFRCIRTASYLKMLDNNKQNNSDNNNILLEEDTTTKTNVITTILQNYVDKKTDGNYNLNGKEINCAMIIQGINDKLGNN